MSLPPGERRFLTDDNDQDDQRELAIFFGGNGDWYVGVMPAGQRDMRNWVRVRNSGGANSTHPGLGPAIAAAFRALDPSGDRKPAKYDRATVGAVFEAVQKRLAGDCDDIERALDELEHELLEEV